MKKILFFILMLASTSCFASTDNTLGNLWNQVTNTLKSAPSGTTYGIVEHTSDRIVLSTPLGNVTINRNADGSYTCMGVTARLLSAKNGVYRVETTVGTFTINTRKGTVTKD